jgi:hypothetical protein
MEEESPFEGTFLKKEFLEVSFHDEFKNQQKKHKSLDPMTLNQKLMQLIPIIPYDRLGENGQYFIDDTNESESPKNVTRRTLLKLKQKKNKFKNNEKMIELRKSFDFNVNNNKTIIFPFINTIQKNKKKRNSVELIQSTKMNITRNNRKLNTFSSSISPNKKYFFSGMNKQNKEKTKIMRRFSLIENNTSLEIAFKRYRLKK